MTEITDSKGRRERWGRLAVVLVITGGFGLVGLVFSTHVLGSYGYMLFMGLPVVIGFIAVGFWGQDKQLHQTLLFTSGVVMVPWMLALLSGLEGVICLVMAAPLWIPAGMVGGFFAWWVFHQPVGETHRKTLILLAGVLTPLLMGAEQMLKRQPPLWVVHSSIEIDASPQQVWDQTIRFDDMAEPVDSIFKAGVAYPIRAELDGEGVGAERRCVFNTGDFVEPITVWDPPRVLAFSVTHVPTPMRELTFYDKVDAPHLEGYFRSERGRFDLVEQPEGRTRLEGRTWYRHELWPAWYWRLWSDAIIHRIHMRVLKHIKSQAERANPSSHPISTMNGSMPWPRNQQR